MSFISNLARSVINPMTLAQLAMGPAGWASLAIRTIGSQIAMKVIEQVGQQLGLPQAAVSLAQAAFASASGQPNLVPGKLREALDEMSELGGLNPAQSGELDRAANDTVKQMTDAVLKKMRNSGSEDGEDAVSGGSSSRLVKLAKALGKVMDGKMDKMIEIGGKIDKTKKTGELSAQMQALGQELGLISNALNNTIKSIGEAATTMARKN